MRNGQFRKCEFCGKQFRLEEKRTIFGQTKQNYKVRRNDLDELIFSEKKCWKKYEKAKIRDKTRRVSAELGTSGASLKAEYEEH